MKKNNSILVMDKLQFDKIFFKRVGLKNEESTFGFDMEVVIKKNTALDLYKVTIVMEGQKAEEYRLNITLTGFFSFDNSEDGEIEIGIKNDLIEKNAVAIIMPYLRSQISLLTAQPNVECVVLPPFNINNMLSTE